MDRLGLDAALGSIDRAKMNVHGSSLAVGHPFAATGARIVGNLAQIIANAGSGRGFDFSLHSRWHGCCRDPGEATRRGSLPCFSPWVGP